MRRALPGVRFCIRIRLYQALCKGPRKLQVRSHPALSLSVVCQCCRRETSLWKSSTSQRSRGPSPEVNRNLRHGQCVHVRQEVLCQMWKRWRADAK